MLDKKICSDIESSQFSKGEKMKKLLLLVLVLFIGACYTGPEDTDPVQPEDIHIIDDTNFYDTQNTTEQWVVGEWIQTKGVAPIGFSPYIKFSFDSIKGQWVVFINSLSSPVNIVESSYKVEENFWGQDSHRLASWLYPDSSQDNTDTSVHMYIEIVKIDIDKIRVYHRGFDLMNLPEDTEIFDPKDAVRTLGDDKYTEYQRIDR